MKIAISYSFFLPVPPVQGGAMEKIFFNIGRRLAAKGHEVIAFTRQWSDWPDQETIDGVTFHRLPGWDHTPDLWRNLILDFRWGLRVRKALPPDAVVIANNVFLPLLLRRFFKPHPAPVTVVLGRMPKGQVRHYRGVERIYATSEAVAARSRYESPAADREGRIQLLRNSIDWHAHQGETTNKCSRIRIGFAGRIHPEKGLDQLIDAAGLLKKLPDLPDWEVTLKGPVETQSGGGGEAFRDKLLNRARESGAESQIQFLPPAWDPVRLAEYYRSLSIFCYPSRAEKGEGLSVAPIEAMASGAVPVLSELDCYDDLIITGENGFLFDHRDSNSAVQLASKLESLLRDHDRRSRMSAHARQTARGFDYDEVAADLERDLANLLK